MWPILRTFLFTDPIVVVATLAMGTLSLLLAPFDRDGHLQFAVGQYWARMLRWGMGITVSVEGLEKLDLSKNYIFAGNHLSYTDTVVMLSSLPVRFRFLAKSGLFQIPLLGTHLKTAGHIPVVLENPWKAVRTLSKAGRTIREKSLSLLIFPEGGRTEGILEPFKGGAAYLAIKSGVPVVPFALIGTREVLPMFSSIFHPGHVRVKIGEPMISDGLTRLNRKPFTAELFHRVKQMLEGRYGTA